MAKTYNRLEIDVNKKPSNIGIRPVQGDTKSRYLDVSLYENGVAIDLTGEQVRINFKKADGTTLFNQGEVTDAKKGRCQFALTNEILAEAKAVKAQISVWNAKGEILSTETFDVLVSESIRDDEAVESENEFGVLVVLFQEIQNALDTMQHISDSFGEPGEKAAEYGVDTFWGILETLAGRGDVESSLQKGIKAYLNSTVGTSGFQSLDKLINYRRVVITENTNFPIPTGVKVIKVALAVSAGEDGSTGSGVTAGQGGNAGAYVTNFLYPVEGLSTLPITVGSGNTIIGDMITLLKGGGPKGGEAGVTGGSSAFTSGSDGSLPDVDLAGWLLLSKAGRGGEKGYSYASGGTGGHGLCASGGGGGGANTQGSSSTSSQKGTDAEGYGCGGGGCGGKNRASSADVERIAGKGTNGIVILEW